MSRFLLLLILCLPGGVLCADPGAPVPVPEATAAAPSAPADQKAKKKLSSFDSMLPPAGTPFKELRLPRFVERKLSSYITSDLVKMLTDTILYGEKVHVRLFNSLGDQTEAELEDAYYDDDTVLLKSSKPVLLKDSRFTAEGSGIIMNTVTKEGFMYGPVKTVFQLNQPTSSTQ